MKTNTLIILIALICGSFSVGAATATTEFCDESLGVCAAAGGTSSGAGSCTEGDRLYRQENGVSFSSVGTPAGDTEVSVRSVCYHQKSFITSWSDAVEVQAENSVVGSAGVNWQERSLGGAPQCTTLVLVQLAGEEQLRQDLGCPAGGPPGSELPVLP